MSLNESPDRRKLERFGRAERQLHVIDPVASVPRIPRRCVLDIRPAVEHGLEIATLRVEDVRQRGAESNQTAVIDDPERLWLSRGEWLGKADPQGGPRVTPVVRQRCTGLVEDGIDSQLAVQ